MKKKVLFLLLTVLFTNVVITAQNRKDSLNTKVGASGFKEYYPIHIKPSISYLSGLNKYEDILFDAKPTVYYSFYNNMRYKTQNDPEGLHHTIYVLFQPQIRMYSEKSLPVKTPYCTILNQKRPTFL